MAAREALTLQARVRFDGGATITILKIEYMTVKVKKIAENAVIPQKAHKSDAGFDLTVSSITTEINEVGELIIVYHTGLCIEIPDGY